MKFKIIPFVLSLFIFFSCNINSDYTNNNFEENDIVLYTIKYENNGYGQSIEEKKVKSNTLLTSEYLPTLESDGMFFRGWLLNNNEISNDTQITTDITLYADWCNIKSISDGICTKVNDLNKNLLKDIGITTIYIMDACPTQSLIISNLKNIDKDKQKIKLNFSFCNKMNNLSIEITDSEIVDSIVIPKNVTKINYNTFHTTGISKVIYYTGNIADWCKMIFDKETSFNNDLYINNMKLEGKIIIPEGVTEINPYVFFGFNTITSVSFPTSLKKIGKGAFEWAALEEIVLTDNIEIIDDYAFVCCNSPSIHFSKNLRKIGYCSFQRNNFTTIDFSNTKLETVTEKSFYGCEKLESLIISDNIRTLGKYCFYDCKRLTSVNISNSLTFIDEGVFWGCSSLNELNFSGTQSEWNALEKSFSWNKNSEIKSIKCSDGIINL